MKTRIFVLILAMFLLTACANPVQESPKAAPQIPAETVMEKTTVPAETEEEILPEPQDLIFVVVKDYIPDIYVDLKYATEDNFTGHIIYDFTNAYLRYGTVAKLAAVQADLKELGMGLKIWDGFRPVSAQYALWEVCPDNRYVANPKKGFSSHSRGNTVDVTLVDSEGNDLSMPSDFDDFSAKADRDYSDCTPEAANNAQILEILMEKHGFTGYKAEWWHFSDTVKYPVEEHFEP